MRTGILTYIPHVDGTYTYGREWTELWFLWDFRSLLELPPDNGQSRDISDNRDCRSLLELLLDASESRGISDNWDGPTFVPIRP
jgi:hypothetical protein